MQDSFEYADENFIASYVDELNLYRKLRHKMARVKLDRIDKKILNNLQENGRMTNVDLASEAGISAPPCLRRVRALEENGLITGYHAVIDKSSLGYGVTVFAQVKLETHSDKDLVAFEEKVGAWDRVRECHMLAGEVDFILKIVAKDWDDYQKFLTNELTASPNVSSVKSALTIRESKFKPGVPINID